MSKPIIFIDFETTGLDAAIHAPISIAAVVCGGPHDNATFDATMRPFLGAQINPFALQVNGYTAPEITRFADPSGVLESFIGFLDENIPQDAALIPGGYCYHFDEKFLREWMLRNHADPAWYGNTFSPEYIEVMKHIKSTFPTWRTLFPNMKLSTQFECHFGTPLAAAHTALADVLATRDLFLLCDNLNPNPKYAHCTKNFSLPPSVHLVDPVARDEHNNSPESQCPVASCNP